MVKGASTLDDGFEVSIPAWHGEDSWLWAIREPPHRMDHPHWHRHVELNFLAGCSMTYRCGEHQLRVPAGHIALFWAAIPHQVVATHGDGELTCLYLSLAEFMRWKLPVRFSHEVMHGNFLVATGEDPGDGAAFSRWLDDYQRGEPQLQRQALDEIQIRLRRLALTGWRNGDRTVSAVRSPSAPGTPQRNPGVARGMVHVEAMATYIAAHYHEPISVVDVADHVGLHPNYAMSLFKRAVGLSIAAYVTRHRLSHAQAMLLDTERKVASVAMDCGFGSLSRFYEAFRTHLHRTPREYRDEMRG